MRHKTVLGVTLSRLIGLLLFLILFSIAILLPIENLEYMRFMAFLSANLGIIIIFSIFFYLGELFFVFRFPFNFPGPIFNAAGGIFLVYFLFGMFYFLGDTFMNSMLYPFKILEPLIYFLVFSIILIAGYISIFMNLKQKEESKKLHKKYAKHKESELKDIEYDFKEVANKVITNIKKSLEPKKEDKKTVKKKKTKSTKTKKKK